MLPRILLGTQNETDSSFRYLTTIVSFFAAANPTIAVNNYFLGFLDFFYLFVKGYIPLVPLVFCVWVAHFHLCSLNG